MPSLNNLGNFNNRPADDSYATLAQIVLANQQQQLQKQYYEQALIPQAQAGTASILQNNAQGAAKFDEFQANRGVRDTLAQQAVQGGQQALDQGTQNLAIGKTRLDTAQLDNKKTSAELDRYMEDQGIWGQSFRKIDKVLGIQRGMAAVGQVQENTKRTQMENRALAAQLEQQKAVQDPNTPQGRSVRTQKFLEDIKGNPDLLYYAEANTESMARGYELPPESVQGLVAGHKAMLQDQARFKLDTDRAASQRQQLIDAMQTAGRIGNKEQALAAAKLIVTSDPSFRAAVSNNALDPEAFLESRAMDVMQAYGVETKGGAAKPAADQQQAPAPAGRSMIDMNSQPFQTAPAAMGNNPPMAQQPAPASNQPAASPAAQVALPKNATGDYVIRNEMDWAKVPSGATVQLPDGRRKIKP